MFFAINSETNEKVNSITIEQNPSYNFIEEDIWYADPDEIESCPKEIDIEKIIVKFRQGHETINYQGTKYIVSPHFFIPNKEKLGINTIPESKEHKLAKNWIYNKIKNKNLIINYSKINKPYKYSNKLNLFDLPIDFNKIGIEVTSSKMGGTSSRRADVICPFIIKHPILYQVLQQQAAHLTLGLRHQISQTSYYLFLYSMSLILYLLHLLYNT